MIEKFYLQNYTGIISLLITHGENELVNCMTPDSFPWESGAETIIPCGLSSDVVVMPGPLDIGPELIWIPYIKRNVVVGPLGQA